MLYIKPYEPQLLLPVDKLSWREPSHSIPYDVFGNKNQTRFRIRARKRYDDGYIKTVWTGWFDDRDDFDQFLWVLFKQIHMEEPMAKEDWHLPQPMWYPGIGADEKIEYDFATVTFFTSPTGSTQSYTIPSDWNNASNQVEAIGAGGDGAIVFSGSTPLFASGGGGGAYAKSTNLVYTTSKVVTLQVGSGGTQVNTTTTLVKSGPNGTSSWFDGATLAASVVGAEFGRGGRALNSGTAASGGSGGTTANSVGSIKNAGGRGGNTGAASGQTEAAGGGGAAGPNGAGNQGGDLTATGQSAGGSADAGSGGAGGTAGNSGGPGGNGTEWDASHGSGGGGGGGASISGTLNYTGGAGGNYGGGGGGLAARPIAHAMQTGVGMQGIVVVTYTPTTVKWFNAAMMGL